MKKTLTLLMLLVMGVVLLSTTQAFAEDVPDETPEMNSVGQSTFAIQSANLIEEAEPEPEPEEEPIE